MALAIKEVSGVMAGKVPNGAEEKPAILDSWGPVGAPGRRAGPRAVDNGCMEGLHLTADLGGCDPARAPMTDPGALRQLCLDAVEAAALTPVGELFHRFPGLHQGGPGGVTGVVLLAESHLAVHTWPERAAVTLDVYVCNLGADNSDRARLLMQRLESAFAPQRASHRALHRGEGT